MLSQRQPTKCYDCHIIVSFIHILIFSSPLMSIRTSANELVSLIRAQTGQQQLLQHQYLCHPSLMLLSQNYRPSCPVWMPLQNPLLQLHRFYLMLLLPIQAQDLITLPCQHVTLPPQHMGPGNGLMQAAPMGGKQGSLQVRPRHWGMPQLSLH